MATDAERPRSWPLTRNLATDAEKPAAEHAPPMVPAPVAHTILLVLTLLPLVVPVPTNLNIVLTAAATVFCGSWRSLKPEAPADAMTKKDAMKFPLIGSALLFSLFLAFKFLPKDLVNLVLSAYFVLIGTFAIVATVDPLVAPLVPRRLRDVPIEIRVPPVPLVLKEGLELSFTPLEAALSLPAAAFCSWYWRTKHWAASNVLGLAFSLQGIEHLSLGAVQNGVILLAGLFVYDVFWVFCTPVMVSVAKSFDAPIKLLFPRVPLLPGKPQLAMLGLGDIVIPGIFVALVLRYDVAHNGGRPRFFYSTFAGYVAGLAATIVVMNVFQAAQPALLYIVPAVLLATFTHAGVNRECSKLMYWQETEHGKKEEQEAEGEGDDDGGGAQTPERAALQQGAGEGEDGGKRGTRSTAKAGKKDS